MIKWVGDGLQIGRIKYTAHITSLAMFWIAITAFQPIVAKLLGDSPFAGPICVALGLGFVLSLLLHEAGHAYTAINIGVDVPEISLIAIGGVAKMAGRPQSAWQEFLIAIAGPLVSFALWLLCSTPRYFGIDATWAKLIGELGFYNLVIALFNMVPAFPMDGGRVFRAVLWGATKNVVRATTVAVRVAEVLATSYLVFNIWQIALIKFNIIFTVLICAFVVFAGEYELKMLKDENRPRKGKRRNT